MAVVETRAMLTDRCVDCGLLRRNWYDDGDWQDCNPPGSGLVGTHRWKTDEPAILVTI